MRRLPLTIALVVLAGGQPALAAPKKSPAKASRPTVKPAAKPPVPVPVEPPKPMGFMVPKVVVLRNPTPVETEANAVWNVRAALNVAALQCQFSPFLSTVKNYNDLLRHHGEELTRAQATMVAHFRRYDGARAANSFDQYTTRTYNSYSTLDAQYKFCEAAGRVGREALAIPRGKLGAAALRLSGETRSALNEQPLSPALALVPMELLVIDPITEP
ncbi:hypothetical protein [Sandarakinorhabdus sp. DWP1-3-1]|uniref:hypothetical protein n=1 Tax=Sandarakinorhabdus sp. DWP1-3-1 TaxID=2804627 RepID=UPI003CE8FF68